jgi:hypothetical protein
MAVIKVAISIANHTALATDASCENPNHEITMATGT